MKLAKLKYTFILTALFVSLASYGFDKSEIIYRAYINNEMDKWKVVIESYNKKNLTPEQHAELLNYQYGYIAWCIGNDKHETARQLLNDAYLNIKHLKKSGYNNAEINTYRSAFIGYEIGLNMFKAPFIGMQSIEFVNDAIKFDSTYYFAYIQKGNIEYYMPEIFGGSKTKAIYYYLMALNLFPDLEKPNNWNYLSLLGTIIQAYIEIGDLVSAKYYYNYTLEIEPDFQWLTTDLANRIEELSEKFEL